MLLEVTTHEAIQAAESPPKARTRNAQTDAAVKALKPPDKPYRVTDRDGVDVLVSPTDLK